MKTDRKEYLVKMYSRDTKTASLIAEICDEVLDKTGALLEEIRQIYRSTPLVTDNPTDHE